MSVHRPFPVNALRPAGHGLRMASLALLGALAACSSEPEPDAAASNEPVASEATMPASDASQAPDAGETALVDTSAIPPMLRGRWGLVPADCTSDRGDAKGLLTVGADKLEFYESVAELGDVKRIDPSEVTGAFAFSGEGQTWDLEVTLKSPDGGKTMVRTDKGPDAAPAPLTYAKCT